MSNIEDLIKPFVADVNAALEGFEGKIATLSDTLRAVEAKANRPRIAGSDPEPEQVAGRYPAEERKQLIDFVQKGGGLAASTDADGGFLVPRLVADMIEAMIKRQSPVRAIANVVDMQGRLVGFPVANTATASGWAAELAARPATASPDFSSVTPPGGDLYANIGASQQVLDDSIINLEEWIATQVVDEFARAEGSAFVSGDGTNKPRGFLSGPTPVATGDDARAVGTLQYIPTGNASTLGADPMGTLLTMIFTMKPGYRQSEGCGWMMSTAVLNFISGLKDTTGRPLFVPSYREGVPGTLIGFPVYEAEDLPAVAANTFPVAFGNWKRGYIIGDRTPLRLLRDPYSNKPIVQFYWSKRVHGSVYNSECIKLLKVAAT